MTRRRLLVAALCLLAGCSRRKKQATEDAPDARQAPSQAPATVSLRDKLIGTWEIDLPSGESSLSGFEKDGTYQIANSKTVQGKKTWPGKQVGAWEVIREEQGHLHIKRSVNNQSVHVDEIVFLDDDSFYMVKTGSYNVYHRRKQ